MTERPDAIVVAGGRGWARLRVRGLLRNAALARRIASAAPLPVQVLPASGSVRVPIDREHDEAFWVRWLSVASADLPPAPPAPRPATRAAEPPLRGAAAARGGAGAPASPGPAPTPRAGAAAHLPKGVRPHAGGASSGEAVHALEWQALLRQLGVGGRALDLSSGLEAAEAAARLARDGTNEILDVLPRSDGEILLDQFRSVPVALLGASAAMSLATRAFIDAGAIGAVLAVNSALGFVTERRAEQTVSALRRLGPRQARVLRDSQVLTVDAREVVRGDLLLLQPGDAVPADARVFESHRLASNEAALTGESLPVRKEPANALLAGAALGERRNMLFMGTVISGGMGRAVVTATGEHTVLGQIRRLAQAAESPHTKLQTELDSLGRRLGIGAAALCLLVLALGALRGRPLLPLLRTAVSLAVAAIPEGLPTVATSLLATSIRELRERQIFARRLDAVENLGAVDTVCFDKTGTLTQNRMTVVAVTVGLEVVDVDDGAPASGGPGLPADALRVLGLCHTVERADGADDAAPSDGDPKVVAARDTGATGRAAAAAAWQGSSTEIALIEYAQARGADVGALQSRHPQLGVRHRSEHHPYMVTLHAAGRGLLVAVKGRPDAVLERCDRWFDGHGLQPLGAATRKQLLALNQSLADRGQRVLAIASREQASRRYGDTGGLTWLGLAGMADPPRPGLPEMVRRFQAAGIRPMMITGDQIGTARAVAREVGLGDGDALVDAATLPESAEKIAPLTEGASGFARTSPAMKLEIVRALQRQGHVVAMTGDGINDGPALKIADVGVAMGVSGTDFAHAMSDLVLREDHPAAMLKAIEQGRTTFVNVRKSVRYLVATNLSELAATVIAVATGLPEPLDPLALLWTNIATDIWPAVALGLEPPEPGILEQPPVSLAEGLLDRRERRALALDSGAMTAAALASFGVGLARYGPGPQARTMTFMTLTSSQLLYALAMRSPRPLRLGGLAPNPNLRHAVGWSLLAQAGTVLLPPLRRLLGTAPLGPADLAVVALTAVVPLAVRELYKEWAYQEAKAAGVTAVAAAARPEPKPEPVAMAKRRRRSAESTASTPAGARPRRPATRRQDKGKA
jgi:Ca2+-transporting ATPase